MLEDEAFNRKALGELILKLTSKHGGDVGKPDALKLRNIIKRLGQQFPQPKKLNAGKTAAEGAVEMAYCEYIGCRSMPCIAPSRHWGITYGASAYMKRSNSCLASFPGPRLRRRCPQSCMRAVR